MVGVVVLGVVLTSLALAGAWSGQRPAPRADAGCAVTAAGAPGIAAGSSIQRLDARQLSDELNGLQTLGSRWLRLDVTWSIVQDKGANSYDWSRVDPAIQSALARGINVDGSLLYTPTWAKPAGAYDDHFPPTDPSLFAAFAAAAVRRYAPMGLHTWEIWNEPNNPEFWRPSANIAQYAVLLKQAYAAIKAVDPTSTVLAGGTAPASTTSTSLSPVDFLNGLYANGAGGFFDAVGDHPYSFPRLPTDASPRSAWTQMDGTDPSLRSVMVAHGDSAKRIWATEYGAPTYPDGVTDQQQATEIMQAYEIFRSTPWAGPLFVYSYRDVGTDPSNGEDFFGLLRFEGSRKGSWEVFRQAAHAFATGCSR
jgi:hypothetical protein